MSTVVLNDTMQPSLPPSSKQSFGNGFAFGFDQKIKGNLLFQVQVWFKVRDSLTNEELCEFRTLTRYSVENETNNPLFIVAMYKLILEAIIEFNSMFQTNTSVGILKRAYYPMVRPEQALKPLRMALVTMNFKDKLSSN